jgi:hypothetical protein
MGGPLAADDVPYYLAKPDPDGATAQALNAMGFAADKVNLAMDAAKYYQVMDEFAPYARFLGRTAGGAAILADGYSVWSSYSNGQIPISGTIGLGTAAMGLVLSGPPGLVVGGAGALASFAIEDPSLVEVQVSVNNHLFQLYSDVLRTTQGPGQYGGFGTSH